MFMLSEISMIACNCFECSEVNVVFFFVSCVFEITEKKLVFKKLFAVSVAADLAQ